MRRVTKWCAAMGVAAAMGAGCKKGSETTGAAGTGAQPGSASTSAAQPAAAALRPVGMDNPFQHITSDGAKQLNAGFAALKAKRWDDARAAFQKVREQTPDYGTARWYEVRATALGGHFADVVPLWGELLSRDFVGYAGKLDKPKDLAPLRAAPEWAQLQDLEKRYRDAYAAGLTDGKQGFFFVARAREFRKPTNLDKPLALNQELYFFAPSTGRYRRLSSTDGHFYAYAIAPDRKSIAFLTLTKVCDAGRRGTMPCEAGAGTLDLSTLAAVGPFPLPVEGSSIAIGFDPSGQPYWDAGPEGDDKLSQLDAAHTAIVAVDVKLDESKLGNRTVADLDSVEHIGQEAADVKVEDKAITLTGTPAPLRVSRAVAPSSIDWSPGHKKLVYAGVMDPCVALGAGAKAEKNELFVWDADKKVASRVAHEVATFETMWLDDDHLVYEGGIGKSGRLHAFDFATRADAVLKASAGAGLWGYPALFCDAGGAEAGGAGDDGEAAATGEDADGGAGQ